jgi:hypothetical protein
MPLILFIQFMSERGFLHEVTVHSKLSSQQALENWICEKKDYLISKLEKTGAILFSGLPVKDANDFDHFVSTFQFKAFTYGESLSNAVRINKTDKVLTANEAPREIEIYLHHELAQTPVYPRYIFFFCTSASELGGETPICRSDHLYSKILEEDPELMKKFEKFGVIYNSIMSNGDELDSGQGRSWQKTLGAATKEKAEKNLHNLGYKWKWMNKDELLVTTRVFKAVKTLTGGTKSFFNQVLAASLGWKNNSTLALPPVLFGNGDLIREPSIRLVSEAAESITLLRKWSDGDILMIDNHRVMHGRKPFSGNKTREVLVSLTA